MIIEINKFKLNNKITSLLSIFTTIVANFRLTIKIINRKNYKSDHVYWICVRSLHLCHWLRVNPCRVFLSPDHGKHSDRHRRIGKDSHPTDFIRLMHSEKQTLETLLKVRMKYQLYNNNNNILYNNNNILYNKWC